jgi:hypothetical protein
VARKDNTVHTHIEVNDNNSNSIIIIIIIIIIIESTTLGCSPVTESLYQVPLKSVSWFRSWMGQTHKQHGYLIRLLPIRKKGNWVRKKIAKEEAFGRYVCELQNELYFYHLILHANISCPNFRLAI